MPKVSVITTTYNHSKYIGETIDSIIKQSFEDWELLVGDDNSPDNTYEIASKYSKNDYRVKVWKHEKNLGIVGNLNFLINKVSPESEYVAFLEGDDVYVSSHLEKKYATFIKYPDLALIYNNLDFIDKDSNIIYKNFLQKAPFYLKNQKLGKKQFIQYETFYGSYSSLMLKKEVLLKEKIKNPTIDKLFTVSDWDLFFRIVTEYRSYGIEESLTLYRRHPQNLSNQYVKLFHDLGIQLEIYRESGFIDEKMYSEKISYVNILKSVAYLEKGEKKQSRTYLYKSLKNKYFSYILYKISIGIMLLFPQKIIGIILKKVIKR